MKQLIISKTWTFLFVILFVTGFQAVFGQQNVLIGVTTVVAILMYMERDLTVSPWKNLILLLVFNLLQGIMGQLAIINPLIGLPINFLAMFTVGYFFTSAVKNPLHIAAGLQYLFILTNPVPFEEFPLRLLSLAVGALLIMLAQILLNRRKLSKSGNQYFLQVCSHLQEKISLIREKKPNDRLDSVIENDINQFRKLIYYRRINGYFLTNESRVRLKISVCLEKLHLILSRSNMPDGQEDVLFALEKVMDQLKESVVSGTKLSNTLLNDLHIALKKYKAAYIAEMIDSLKLLHELLTYLQMNDRSELEKVEKVIDIPKGYRNTYLHLKEVSRNSVRFTYAMRLGITIAAAAFICDSFDIVDGRWILFTIFSVTQPYYETAKYRFKERIIGTLMGATIFIVLFSIFQNATVRSLLVLLAGYLNGFAGNYRNIVLTVTISALGTAALVGDPEVLTIRRIILVLIGVGIGMLSNRYILPHRLEKGTIDLIEMYKQVSRDLLREVHCYLKDNTNAHTINHLFAVSALMEERIISNNKFLNREKMNEFLYAQRRLNHAIYEVFLRMQQQQVDNSLMGELFKDIETILNSEGNHVEQQIDRLYEKLQTAESLEEYVFFKDALRIFKGLRKQAWFE